MTEAEIALIRRVPVRWKWWDGVVAESDEWVSDVRLLVRKSLHEKRVVKLCEAVHPYRDHAKSAEFLDGFVGDQVPAGRYVGSLAGIWRGDEHVPYVAEFTYYSGERSVYLNALFLRLTSLLIGDLRNVKVRVRNPHDAVWFTRDSERLVAISPLRPERIDEYRGEPLEWPERVEGAHA